MKGNCADLHWAAWSICRALRHRAGRRAHPLQKPVLAGCRTITTAGTVARGERPVEQAVLARCDGPAPFIRVLGDGPL